MIRSHFTPFICINFACCIFPFLHFPKVEILDRQIAIKSVSIAGGEEAAKALGFEIIEEEEQEDGEAKEKTPKDQEPSKPTEEKETEEQKPTEKDQNLVVADAKEIGFTMQSDSKDETEEKKSEEGRMDSIKLVSCVIIMSTE